MKYYLTIFLTIFCLITDAQNKGDNLIVVPNQVFDSVIIKLLDHGYILTDLNEKFQLVTVQDNEHEFRLRVKENGELWIFIIDRTAGVYSVAKDLGGVFSKAFKSSGKFATLFGTPEYRKVKIGL